MSRPARTLPPLLLAGALALALIAPLAALDAPPAEPPAAVIAEQADAGSGVDVTPVVIWGLVGAAILCAVLGVLYLLKRELGGFDPRPGAWTAPISVMPSGELPAEESDFPDPPEDDGHGH